MAIKMYFLKKNLGWIFLTAIILVVAFFGGILIAKHYLEINEISSVNENGSQTTNAQNDEKEQKKIDALIEYVRTLKGVFIRNGVEYTPQEAADHLRDKLSYAGDGIKTARDFIENVASRSSVTGEVYQVKLSDGSIRNVGDVLNEKLIEIETGN